MELGPDGPVRKDLDGCLAEALGSRCVLDVALLLLVEVVLVLLARCLALTPLLCLLEVERHEVLKLLRSLVLKVVLLLLVEGLLLDHVESVVVVLVVPRLRGRYEVVHPSNAFAHVERLERQVLKHFRHRVKRRPPGCGGKR